MQYPCSVLLSLGAVNCIDPLVWTTAGFVQGATDGKVISFMGIPYARVDPRNPFGDTMDVLPFDGVFVANNDKVICPQLEDTNFRIVGTLNCLRINVYIPEGTDLDDLLPVMIFIHGGDFRSGNSNRQTYGPNYLVDKGVILVTFNYRLGPYGFMSLNTSEVSGNAGLRDQLKALEWVKENIGAFGGDSEDITLFGQNAGAASVEFHILSENSKNLFHKAILQSGTVFCDWVMTEPNMKAPIQLAKYLGLETDNVEDALKHLCQFHPKYVIKASLNIGLMDSFKPVIEHTFDNVKAMVKDKPSNLWDDVFVNMPIIIGFNSREEYRNIRYYGQTRIGYITRANSTFKDKIGKYFTMDKDDLRQAEKLAKYFYIGDGPKTIDALLDFDSDFSFIYPSLRSGRQYLHPGVPVYFYIFDYSGERNLIKNKYELSLDYGAMHGDEIGYLFEQYNGELDTFAYTNTFEDNVFIERMTTMWTEFAKTSNPTPESFPFNWTAAAVTSDPKYAILSKKFDMMGHPYQRRMDFWDRFFEIFEEFLKW